LLVINNDMRYFATNILAKFRTNDSNYYNLQMLPTFIHPICFRCLHGVSCHIEHHRKINTVCTAEASQI